MAREKELYRENLARLDAAFPGKEVLGKREVRDYLYLDEEGRKLTGEARKALDRNNMRRMRRRNFPWIRDEINKTALARAMS